jgi:hypothetical protein
MHSKSLNKLYDFMHVPYSTKEHQAKNEDFPMHIIFTRIYLLQEQKLFWVENNSEQFCTS